MPLLSGMLIASDVQGAVRLFGAPGARTTVQLIGTPPPDRSVRPGTGFPGL
jgi:hypothetical protein